MTDQAIPIRKFNDDEALAWLRARPDDPLSASALVRAWGWPRSRVRRRLKAWKAAGLIGQPGQRAKPATWPAR
jgi:DNA-binding IclR family transcriptional regulator